MLRIAALSLTSTVALLAADLPVSLPTKSEVAALIDQGQAFLMSKAQADGSFMPGDKFKLGITQLAAEALASQPNGLVKDHPIIAAAVRFQEGSIQADGGVYGKEGNNNYTTSLALMVWSATGTGTPAQISGAQQYLFSIQNDAAGSINRGGIGYGSKGKGHEDLSNTAYAIAALRSSGVPASDPHLQAALGFLERCQDLSSVPFDGDGAAGNTVNGQRQVNALPWVKNTGGAVYAPDESKAGGSWKQGDEGNAKLLPYGSMTYTLISSYLSLDLRPNDPRVLAALGWVKSNYQFEVNPGMPNETDSNGNPKNQQGLFYYFTAMGKTFDLLDQGLMTLPDGRAVDWRADLFATLKTRAKADTASGGMFWVNDADRWGEGLPQLVTAYAVKTLKRVHASLE